MRRTAGAQGCRVSPTKHPETPFTRTSFAARWLEAVAEVWSPWCASRAAHRQHRSRRAAVHAAHRHPDRRHCLWLIVDGQLVAQIGGAGDGRPQPQGVIVAAGDDALPVGAERRAGRPVGAPGQGCADGLAGVGIPQPARPGVARYRLHPNLPRAPGARRQSQLITSEALSRPPGPCSPTSPLQPKFRCARPGLKMGWRSPISPRPRHAGPWTPRQKMDPHDFV